MKNTLLIVLALVSISSFAQNTWVKWNGHIFLKQGNDSIYFGDDDILSTMPAILSSTNIKTINGLSILGNGNLTLLVPSGNGSALTGLTSAQVGLGNANNTSDANKPISTATQIALDGKQATGSYATGGGTATGTNTGDNATNTQYSGLAASKQNVLVSGTTIKTINGATVLGSGDLVVSGSAAFSSITGQPTDNANLTTALNLKANLASPTFTGTVTMPAGMIGIPEWARVTGSNATTTGQTLVDITGLSRALVANATYAFEANMSASTSAVTTGTSYGVQYSAAGATIEANIIAASSTTAAKAERINAFNTNTTTFLATSAQTGGVVITGIVTTGANSGNLTIQHRKLTSGTSTIFINSYLKVIRIQ